ncbi:MAG: TolC family protein [Myxococcota bacterium]
MTTLLLYALLLGDAQPVGLSTTVYPIEDSSSFAVDGVAGDNERPWWLAFDDPLLHRAIERALANNYDVRAAAERIVQAEATALQRLAPMLPSVTADASGNFSNASALGFQFGGLGGGGGGGAVPTQDPLLVYNASAGLNARWNLDIWGQSYLAYRAATLQGRASEGDRNSVRFALAGQVAAAYYDVVLAKESIEVVEAQVESNRRLLELLELRFERGESTGLDVLQQKQQVAARAAEVPPLRSQLRASQQQLAILMGEAPSRTPPASVDSLPDLPPAPGLGTPAQLLENRPDLRASVLRSEAAAKNASSALRVHLPTLSVNGNFGWQWFRSNTTPDDPAPGDPPGLDRSDTARTDVWGAGVALSVPLFSGFGDVGQVREARASESEALASLTQAHLSAVSEVESAVISETETLEQLRLLREQSTAAEAALEESEARYIAGLADYLSVLTALSAAQSVQRQILQVERATLSARLQLYQSLGGAWTREFEVALESSP